MQRSAGSAGEITKPADALKSKPARIEIKGRIVDESGGGIPYASVQVQAEKWADSLGNYTLQVPAKIDSVVLVYSAVGFENVERNMMLTDDANQRQDICLGLKPYLGEVVVTGYSTELRTYIAGEVSTVKHSISRKSKAPLCNSNLFPARYISISPRLLQAFFFRLSLQVISAGAF